MKKFTLFFLFSITFLNGFAQGEIVNYSIMHGDSLRTYILYVPSGYDGTEEWPLVISLHGYTQTAELQMIYTDMNSVADTGHFLVVYPQALLMSANLPGLPPQGPGWNSSEEGDPLYSSPGNTDDVDFIRQVISKIEADYTIAPERIYATGFSAGAFMCYVLACELEDKIAAIAPVSGTPRFGRSCTPDRPVPVMHIHGTEDPNIPYGGVPPLVISVEETIDFWLGQNGCNEEPVITQFTDINTEDSTTVEMYQWNNCEAEFVHLKVIGGGHQWPGGVDLLPPYFGRMNQDISANGEMWNFFRRNPHPGVAAKSKLVAGSFNFDGIKRDYTVFLPHNYQPNMPVVLNLHGYNQSIHNLMDYTLMNDFADKEGFIVVYPIGTGLKWNSGARDGRSLPNTDDVGFISALIDTLEVHYTVDMNRIYCTGFSNGAEMTYRLAAELGDRIAAIAPVCGGLNNNANNWSQIYQVPILDINGTADPYRNWGFDLWSVDKTFDFWSQHNECSDPVEKVMLTDINTEDNCTVERISLTNCANNISIVNYRIIKGGHQWPGANIALDFWGGGTMNQDIIANVEIWNFFKNYVNTSTFATPTSVSHSRENTSAGFSVYPNPADDHITIELEVSDATSAKLQLVNSLGQVLASTKREIQSAGTYKLEWHLRNDKLSHGLYFLLISLDGDSVLTKSIMLVAE